MLLILFYNDTLFLSSGVILELQKVIHSHLFLFWMMVKKTKKKTMHIVFKLVWCEKHACRSTERKGKQTTKSCLSSNSIFKTVKRYSLVVRTRSVKEYVFPWAFLQDDSRTIWFPFKNSRSGVYAVVPFNLGRYKTQHTYILCTFKMFLIFQCDRELESYIWETD